MWITSWDVMAGYSLRGFGRRLATLRRSRGLTQQELGAAVGSSQRMIAHYETTPDAQPPAALVASLARALGVSADEILGLKPTSEDARSASVRLRKRLRRVEDLTPADQKTLLRMLDALLDQRRAS